MMHEMSMTYMSEYTHNKAYPFINCHQTMRIWKIWSICSNASVVDYAIGSPEFWCHIADFEIMPFCSLSSDYTPFPANVKLIMTIWGARPLWMWFSQINGAEEMLWIISTILLYFLFKNLENKKRAIWKTVTTRIFCVPMILMWHVMVFFMFKRLEWSTHVCTDLENKITWVLPPSQCRHVYFILVSWT